jgi:hypothetical protein
MTVSVGRWRGPFTLAGVEAGNDLCRCGRLPRPQPGNDEEQEA